MGSLIMSPNGEIVCLSLMGAQRDTDIPIRFDFIPEEDEGKPMVIECYLYISCNKIFC